MILFIVFWVLGAIGIVVNVLDLLQGNISGTLNWILWFVGNGLNLVFLLTAGFNVYNWRSGKETHPITAIVALIINYVNLGIAVLFCILFFVTGGMGAGSRIYASVTIFFVLIICGLQFMSYFMLVQIRNTII
mgnify:CR=1 FL=1